jgi:hypothetical protein
MKLKLIVDEEVIGKLFDGLSPFNLKRDYKVCFKSTDFKVRLNRDISIIIKDKTPNSYKIMSIGSIAINDGSVFAVQIRLPKEDSTKGKSSGLRCILLMDLRAELCILLHVLDKKKDEKLEQDEKNKLLKLVNTYIKNREYK